MVDQVCAAQGGVEERSVDADEPFVKKTGVPGFPGDVRVVVKEKDLAGVDREFPAVLDDDRVAGGHKFDAEHPESILRLPPANEFAGAHRGAGSPYEEGAPSQFGAVQVVYGSLRRDVRPFGPLSQDFAAVFPFIGNQLAPRSVIRSLHGMQVNTLFQQLQPFYFGPASGTFRRERFSPPEGGSARAENTKVAKEEKPFDKTQGKKERKGRNLPNDW